MNNFKTKIAVLAICFLSFAGIQTASAVEGLSIGAAMNYSGFMARGKEAATSSGNNIKTIFVKSSFKLYSHEYFADIIFFKEFIKLKFLIIYYF